MTLTAEIRAEIAARLGSEVRKIDSVGGGCISPSYRVWLTSAQCVFVKLAPGAGPVDMLKEEARALGVLQNTGCVRVPNVVALGSTWLALEWLEPAPGARADWAALGAALARLHRVRAAQYGFEADNYIGTLRQRNRRTSSWPEFWREQRVRAQLEQAQSRLTRDTVMLCSRLCDELDARLAAAAADGASLLHGDLWRGNVHMSAAGAALIDPASYYGHREVDLAMAALFGGFAPEFFTAYEAEWPLQSGAAQRRHSYQLYYLLVHVNLFGGGYAQATAAAVRAALDH